MTGPLDLDDLTPADEALELVLGETRVLSGERVSLAAALGRVLAEDVTADADVPPFDRCAMDGVAVRAADLAEPPVSLRLAGTVHAGQVFDGELPPGHAVKVMTGAPLPAGADAVQPVERLREEGNRVVVFDPLEAGRHVAPRGEDLRAGDVALGAGTLIGPAQVGLLATVGCTEVLAHARPMAAVLSTGDELVEPGESPGPGQVRNSNGPMLAVLARVLGCDPVQLLPAARDDPEELRSVLASGLEADVLLVSGGVSKGERDLVAELLARLGVRPLLHGVDIQPGKPLWAGVTDGCLVLALPGNPVSALTTARLFAGPAVRRLRGLPPMPRRWTARLAAPFRRNPKRPGYLPARVELEAERCACHPLEASGSADLVTACRANATWIAPAGRALFSRGEDVEVLLHEDFDERSGPGFP